MKTDVEIWKAIPRAPGYEVSNLGRVRSQLPATRGRLKKVLIGAAGANGPGYPMVTLQIGESDSRRSIRHYVHHLVAEAFIGPRPEGMEIRHLDGEPQNCTAGNLAYGTHSENTFDSVRHGTHNNASRTHCKNGHEFTPENTILRAESGRRPCRRCRACARLEQAAFRARRREEVAS